jgi:hypothetical protein
LADWLTGREESTLCPKSSFAEQSQFPLGVVMQNKANFAAGLMNISLHITKDYEAFLALRLPQEQSQSKPS